VKKRKEEKRKKKEKEKGKRQREQLLLRSVCELLTFLANRAV
jgi:hypothetical protein